MTRLRPENRRSSETVEVEHDRQRYCVSVGFLPDGQTAIEVFVSAVRTASALEALARDGAILISFAIQHGVPLEDLRSAVSRGDHDEPASVIGAVLDAVAANWKRTVA